MRRQQTGVRVNLVGGGGRMASANAVRVEVIGRLDDML